MTRVEAGRERYEESAQPRARLAETGERHETARDASPLCRKELRYGQRATRRGLQVMGHGSEEPG